MSTIHGSDTTSASSWELLDWVQQSAFKYFIDHVNPNNGLIADSTWEGAPCSIAAVGFALAAYAVGVERGFLTRDEAVNRTLVTLRFFHNSPQSPEPDATGYKGFYYHFLDMQSGRRSWRCELSTIDTTCLIAGMLANKMYFDHDVVSEREIRKIADDLYQRVDWEWARNANPTVTHGWKPEDEFLAYRWEGYDEGLALQVLGLGSPTHSLSKDTYTNWTSTFRWENLYGYEYLYAGPLFIHQFSHIWLDLRSIQDSYMQSKGIDYFENSRRATYVQQQYAIHNPRNYAGYGQHCWGITASEGPAGAKGEVTQSQGGVERHFAGYLARGVPEPDDGTLSPWVVIASLPFAPEIVLPTIEHYRVTYPELVGQYGFTCSLNPTFSDASNRNSGWLSKNYYGLNEGPNVLMIENHRSEFIWRLMKQCPYVVEGLRRAGFRGGWL